MKPSLIGSAILALPSISSVLAFSETTERAVSAFAKRDTVSDILTDIEDAATCDACESLLVVLKLLAATGNDAFVDVITDICVDLGLEDEDVCVGSIALEGPILAHDLREITIGSTTSQLFCLTIFGLCQWPDVTPYNVSMSAKPDTTRPAPSGESPIQVVHISDIHVDRFYEEGASYNCTKNICCRSYVAADAPGNTSYPAGAYGNNACDSPVSLEESLYAAIEDLVPDRAFTIFTGDVVEGAIWSVTDTEVGNDLNDAYALMAGLGQYYALVGNHDSCPVNSFPPSEVSTTITSQWVYNNISADWSEWIGSDAATEVANNYGCYSVVDSTTGLRVIAYNSNFWYTDNFWNFEDPQPSDPSGMLAWLVTELEAAETAGERVWLMAHMPPGSTDTFHDQSQYFDQIIQRFDATIAAMFYGHTHKDEFEIAYSDYTDQTADTANMVAYIAPALTPTSGNPAFRVYSVDPVTFGILDYTSYYANISSPTYQSGPTWEKLYSVKEAYGSLLTPPVTNASAEFTPAVWHNITQLFEDDDDVFQAYYGRKNRDYDPASSTCDADCKTTEICQLRAAQAQYNCGTVSPGVNFRKRQMQKRQRQEHEHKRSFTGASVGAGGYGECEGSASAPILSAFTGTEGMANFKAALTKTMGSDWLHTVVPSNYTTGGIAL